MNKQKRLILIIAIIALNINFTGIAISSEEPAPSLQWFPSLAADNGTVYIVWADERNGNYTKIMNNIPHKSGDIYISNGIYNGKDWEFSRSIKVNDDLTDSFTKPGLVFLGPVLGSVWEDLVFYVPFRGCRRLGSAPDII